MASDNLNAHPHTTAHASYMHANCAIAEKQGSFLVEEQSRIRMEKACGPVVSAKRSISRNDKLACGEQKCDGHLGNWQGIMMDVMHSNLWEIHQQVTCRHRYACPWHDQGA